MTKNGQKISLLAIIPIIADQTDQGQFVDVLVILKMLKMNVKK